jgi:nitrous oxidase accessory protein
MRAGGLGLVLATLLLVPAARAATFEVPAEDGALARAVAKARPGDVLVLAPGTHRGGIVIDKKLSISGRPGAVVDGPGTGSVFKVTSPDVSIRGLTIGKSGDQAMDYDSAIYVEKGADRFVAEDNTLTGNLFGIVLHGANSSAVRRNRISNRVDKYETERGNGIHMWAVKDSVIEGNTVTGGRDGILMEVSHGNLLKDNAMEGVRFAVHSMNANRARVIGNTSRHNKIGFALMYSNELEVRDNLSDHDGEHGLMLHTVHHSVVDGNTVRATAEKCVFVYTAAANRIHGNRIENCALGLHFTGGSEDNKVWGNAFVDNQTQVKFTGTIVYEWSQDGIGNYWSDNAAFDLNGDGMADTAYRPNTLMDRVMWRYPLAKMLMSSPVMEALKVAQAQFPALMPGGVVDSHPLMAAPSSRSLAGKPAGAPS